MTGVGQATGCVVVGRPNAGKTLFSLRFAEYLGARELRLVISGAAGDEGRRLAPEEGARELVGPEPHRTRRPQTLELEVRVGKSRRRLQLIDTTGLVDGIHGDPSIRQAMADSLAAVRRSNLILHVIDAAQAGRSGAEAPSAVDYELAAFGATRPGYAILANKMDLPESAAGLARLRRAFASYALFPISALKGIGFDGVKRFVRERL